MTEIYERFAEVFAYPGKNYSGMLINLIALLRRQNHEKAAAELEKFSALISGFSQSELEELYIRTFDVQAATTLDLGYVLFGDDYKRGALLVNLNREHSEAGNNCFNELADHFPNLLRLLPKMQEAELRRELVQKIILPALRKIGSDFAPDKLAKKEKIYQKHHQTLLDSPGELRGAYHYPISAALKLLCADFDIHSADHPAATPGFRKFVSEEMRIEPQ